MSYGLEFLVSIVSAVASVTLTGLLGVIAWYLRGEIREHKKNTAVRRWLVGDPTLEEVEDKGQIDEIDRRFDRVRDDMEEQHEDMRRDIGKIRQLAERIAAQLEASEGFDFRRGGMDQPSDDD